MAQHDIVVGTKVAWRTKWCHRPVDAEIAREYDDIKKTIRIKTLAFGHVVDVAPDELTLKEKT